ncbi:MAG TPA: DUF3108 domain-containing protein [Candidatus Acidoferrales bacterium]|nr:DUF3108 domain-containing protein [Candidatus Acidoferrales bacterium]
MNSLPRLLPGLLLLAAPFQAAEQPLTGFPFQNETLRYNVNWPSGLTLGEVTLTAQKADSGWNFEAVLNVAIPGLSIADRYRSSVTPEYCSTELNRELSRGTKKNTEKTTFDQQGRHATRQTLFPLGGGKTELDTPPCARDALAYEYFARKELGQGRMPPAGRIYFGGEYQVRMEYTGAQNLPAAGKPIVTDHVNVSIKGPASNFTFEVFYARDPARTPLLVRIPVAVGTISLELVR